MRHLRILMTLFLLAVGVSACQDQELYNNLSQRNVNEMMTVLSNAGIPATIEKSASGENAYTLMIPKEHAAAAVQILSSVGLPREKQLSLTEVLPKDSWMASRSQSQARLAYGYAQDLTGTLRQINGIVDARVHVGLAQKNALGQVVSPSSSSVLIRYDAGLLDAEFQTEIRMLVANSISGLAYDNVSVTMVPAATTAQLIQTNSVGAPSIPSAGNANQNWLISLLQIGIALALTLIGAGWLLSKYGRRA